MTDISEADMFMSVSAICNTEEGILDKGILTEFISLHSCIELFTEKLSLRCSQRPDLDFLLII